MDLKFPPAAIIGIIESVNKVIIPNGLTEIKYDDTLIIFTKAEDGNLIKDFFKAGSKCA